MLNMEYSPKTERVKHVSQLKKNHSYKNTVQPDRIQSVIHYFHPQDLLLSACIFQAVPVSFQHCLLPVKCSIHEEEIGHTQKKGMEEKI